jgi:hypothetical protein
MKHLVVTYIPLFVAHDRAAARLAIVPGKTHYDILATTEVARLAGDFLDA